MKLALHLRVVELLGGLESFRNLVRVNTDTLRAVNLATSLVYFKLVHALKIDGVCTDLSADNLDNGVRP